jgi:hypothetical protein
MLVALYLVAIVAANLTVAAFGPSVSILNALLFIGLDLTTRDRLHEAWRGRLLWPRMAALIIAGSLLSWLLNRNAGPIALASCVAFLAAGLVDALTYHALRERAWRVKVNGSNILSALADSYVFVALAGFSPWIIPAQWAAKVIGGAVWSVILGYRKVRLA